MNPKNLYLVCQQTCSGSQQAFLRILVIILLTTRPAPDHFEVPVPDRNKTLTDMSADLQWRLALLPDFTQKQKQFILLNSSLLQFTDVANQIIGPSRTRYPANEEGTVLRINGPKIEENRSR